MFFVRFPGYMSDGIICLRYMKISDGVFLRKQLAYRETLSYTLLHTPVSSSWLRVWLKMKKIFNFAYMIVVDFNPIGFIGIYNLIPGQSARISLVIFDREKRRRGYGSSAFDLLADNLQTYCKVKTIMITYKNDNAAARSFWKKCGFQEQYNQDNIITMSRDIQ